MRNQSSVAVKCYLDKLPVFNDALGVFRALTGGPLLYQLRTFHTRPRGPYLPICCMKGMSAACIGPT